MRVKIPISVTAGPDTADMDVEISVTPEDIVNSIVGESRGLGPMHIAQAFHNVQQFMADMPDDEIERLGTAARAVIARFLRDTADRFAPAISADAAQKEP